jgi:hypothetical protein
VFSISPSWAIALGATGVLLVATIVTMRSPLVSIRGRFAGRSAYLLAGSLVGFMAIAAPPAWPVLAFIGFMLGARAVRDGRNTDFGLMGTGFGAAWTLLLGWGILNDLSDPAVYGSPWDVIPFLVGSAILVGGLVVLLLDAARRPELG